MLCMAAAMLIASPDAMAVDDGDPGPGGSDNSGDNGGNNGPDCTDPARGCGGVCPDDAVCRTARCVPILDLTDSDGDTVADLDEAVAELMERLEDDVGSRRTEYGRQLVTTVLKMLLEQASVGDMKLCNSALKELRWAFKVFGPHRRTRKVTVFGSARTEPGEPAYEQAKDFGARMAERAGLPADLVRTVRNGVDVEGYTPAPRPHDRVSPSERAFDKRLLAMLGESTPEDAGVFAVSIKKRVVNVLYVDQVTTKVPATTYAATAALAESMAQAYEALILRRKGG